MIIRCLFFIGTLLLLLSFGCKKETTSEWTYCVECTGLYWVGVYEGDGDYYSESSSQQQLGTEVQVVVEQLSDDRIKFYILAPDLYEVTFTANKGDNNNYVNVPGSTSSLMATLTQNGSQNRLTGTAKHYHYVYTASDTTLVIDHSLSFEVITIK